MQEADKHVRVPTFDNSEEQVEGVGGRTVGPVGK